MNIANFLQRSGRMYRDSYALALGSRGSATYGQLSSRAAKLAGTLLQKFNLTAGDRVAIIAKNVPEYLEIIYGCWHAGLIIVPINAKLHVNEYAFILKDSGARLCFLSEEVDLVLSKINFSIILSLFGVEISY